MHATDLDLNAMRQLILRIKTDFGRIYEHVNQTPESHLGDVAQDPDWVPPESST